VDQEGVLASLGKFRSLYQALPPYQQREGIRLVIADVKLRGGAGDLDPRETRVGGGPRKTQSAGNTFSPTL